MRISQECWQLILGTLLGDGWLPKIKKGRKNCYLGICHSVKQKEYLLHKFKVLQEIGAKTLISKKTSKVNKTIKALEFVTSSIPQLTELRKILYPKGKKRVPEKYLEKLDDRGLAYWIMDDGSLVWHKRKRKDGVIFSSCEFYLAVNSFNMRDLQTIMNWLKQKYNVDSKPRYHSPSKSFYLVINRHNYKIIAEKVKPYIIPSMSYKIDMSKLGLLVEKTTTPNRINN